VAGIIIIMKDFHDDFPFFFTKALPGVGNMMKLSNGRSGLPCGYNLVTKK
jgi:hypothetical protein